MICNNVSNQEFLSGEHKMRLWSYVMSVLGCLLLSQSAFALSCAQPDIIRSLESVKKSETVYYILIGTFSTPPEERKPRLEQRGGFPAEWQSKPPRIVPSLFNGYESHGISDGQGDPNVPILQISPCPGQTFPIAPKGEFVRKVRKCLNRTCQPQTVY